jgi:hypothetical protein
MKTVSIQIRTGVERDVQVMLQLYSSLLMNQQEIHRGRPNGETMPLTLSASRVAQSKQLEILRGICDYHEYLQV